MACPPPSPRQAHGPRDVPTASGWCDTCQEEHRLFANGARVHALSLRRELETKRRLDYRAAAIGADPRLTTDYLFGPALGQMFGVLECLDGAGKSVVLRAFSAQYNGVWLIDGWVPPVFDVATYNGIMGPGDRRLKALSRAMTTAPPGEREWQALRAERKSLSRELIQQLHALSILRNFRGERRALTSFFGSAKGAPAGAGNCCAPKLINAAVQLGLRPRGLAEFYWGAANRSGARRSGVFYASCAAKCAPILGFMLCGAQP